ncbi:RND transporter [Sesbania bispinosa]|nr:RND transporter [Sesbania bispinosa]
MANAAMRDAQAQVNVGNRSPRLTWISGMMMSVVVSTLLLPHSLRSAWMMWRLWTRDRAGEEDDGEPTLYDDDFDLDYSTLMGVIDNEEVANVHARVNFNWHLGVMEQQCLQQAAFMKYLRGTVVPHFQETQYETMKTAKDKADKSNTSLKAELKRAEKAGGSSAGMDRQAVANLVNKNLSRHQARWEEEKAKLVAIGNNLVKESFENALAQLSLRNPALVRDRASHEFGVFRGQVCKVDTSARKLIGMESGDEVADWDEEGSYWLENE